MTNRSFDPNAGSGSAILVATASADRVSVSNDYAEAIAEREQAIRERDMRSLGFGQRASFCG